MRGAAARLRQPFWIFCKAPMKPALHQVIGTARHWKDHWSPPPARPEEEPLAQSCSHMKEIKFTHTDIDVCGECIKLGDTWVHLRLCLECGHVGCCDSSKNKHE